MRRLRWLLLEIGTAALLLAAVFGTLSASVQAADLEQTRPSTSGVIKRPVPPVNWFAQPTLSPVAAQPKAGATVATPAAPIPSNSTVVTATGAITGTGTPTYYVVLPGDTLFVIASGFGSTTEAVMAANGLSNSDMIHAGQLLLIPGPDGALPDSSLLPVVMADAALTQSVIAPRGTITERMTSLAQQADVTSPFYGTTWLTYYGRPHVDVMGILGEHSIEELVPLLREEAAAYDRANGDALTVTPAFHLVYGMATRAAGDDDSHLAYMSDDEVMAYIDAAEAEGWGVILDVQIGALTPTEAISPALTYLKYENVHLAIDPEFAKVHAGQIVPGNPIGYVTAEQVNAVQATIDQYLTRERLPGPRILLVHQFQSDMIVEPEKLDKSSYPQVALTLSVDGWGGPWGKVSKYNSFVTPDSSYSAFKLFYRWDEPLLLPDEVLGNLPYRGSDFFMDVTPNMVIYQ
ncbi:MAG: LysM peptidoglycan-binding domain-containing protein [Caldilineaceae bacterium]|nr:LysM peptidoglycan-binding domain-containing protein [Caldilineaceae bacterium]